ncbi:MAG: cell division protein FtsA [Bacteroidales bacterium]|nr:cell division protein FtsA [Bacteroidales bacterium]
MDIDTQYVAAIDVGTTKIVTLLGKRAENGKLEIVDFTHSESKGIRRGEVLNPEDAAVVIRQTVEELKSRTNIGFSGVFVGVAGRHIRIQQSRNYVNRPDYEKSIEKADLDKLREDAANIPLESGEEIIHVLPKSYLVDNETDIANPIGMPGKRLEANFNIVIGSSDSLKRVDKCIRQAGLEIKEIILEPLASAAAVLYDEERETGVALVDIGGGTTDIAIFHENVLQYTAVIPFGGDVITKDIKETCGLSEQVAEEIKIQFGTALSNEASENKYIIIPTKVPGREPKEISFHNLAGIIQARMEEIIEAIMFYINASGCSEKLGSGIVITGGGAMLQHLKQLFCYRTGKEVRIGYPGEHLAGDTESINETRFATAVGLLMKGFHYMDTHRDYLCPVSEETEKPIEPFHVKQETENRTEKNRASIFEHIKIKVEEIFKDPDMKF